jgi:hypothetical protein
VFFESFVVKKENAVPRNKKDSQNGRFDFTKAPATVPWCNGSTAVFDTFLQVKEFLNKQQKRQFNIVMLFEFVVS